MVVERQIPKQRLFFVGNSDKVSGSYKNGGIHYNLINMEVWLSWFKAPDLKSDEQ